jgi:hypothetical protein
VAETAGRGWRNGARRPISCAMPFSAPPGEPSSEPRLSLRGLQSDLAGPFDFTLAAR